MLVSRERGGDARREPQVRVSHAAAGLATGVDLLCSSGAGEGETRYVVVELKVGWSRADTYERADAPMKGVLRDLPNSPRMQARAGGSAARRRGTEKPSGPRLSTPSRPW